MHGHLLITGPPNVFFLSTSSHPSVAVMEASSDHKRKLSQHEKYRKALVVTSELASVASGASHVHFHHRIKLLKELIDHWKNGEVSWSG